MLCRQRLSFARSLYSSGFLRTLIQLGLRQVYVPHRLRDGHSATSEANKGNAARNPASDDGHQAFKAIPCNPEIFQPNSALSNTFAGRRQFNHDKSISSRARKCRRAMAKWMLCMEARDEGHLPSQSGSKKAKGGEHRCGDSAT